MVVIYAIIGAFARRWYGGMLENYKILSSRGLQTAFMCLLFMGIYLPASQNWLVAIAITAWLQLQFWSRGHGCCFDIGRSGMPDITMINRYNERWYHIPCDWLASKRFFAYHNMGYDFCYMLLRYTCPMIPMMLFDWRYILIGLAIAPIYAICWELYESLLWKLNKSWCNYPTQLAEIICGALVYGGCYLLGV
jgi:hypothetical protein